MDLYDDLRAHLLAGGMSEKCTNDYIAEMKQEDARLDALVCPECFAELSREVDERRVGDSQVAGKWFRYRCSSCPFWIDRKEPVGEN